MNVSVLPLAITMMAGPQIISAIILVTSGRAVPVSLAFLLGVLAATTVGVTITWGLATLLGGATSLQKPQGWSTTGELIESVLIVLLAALALKNYRGRRTAEPPRWLAGLMGAEPHKALTTGFLVILLMPSDIVVMLTVGMDLKRSESGLLGAVPFIAATLLIAALPLLAYLMFRQRAKVAMPKVRDWLNSHSWLVNIGVCVLFIVLILA